ncbi:hypothetical protein HGRIS_000928 [Hohenbuehelia grisea]
MYDSRSSAYAKLGRTALALADAKRAIDAAPQRWQGYARAARVFLQSGRAAQAGIMARMAKERCDEKRRAEMERLEDEVKEAARKSESSNASSSIPSATSNGKQKGRDVFPTSPLQNLPIEVFVTICEYALSSTTICAAYQASPCSSVDRDSDTNVLTLSHVCGRWRAIVQSAPSLWRTLTLTTSKPVEKAKLWLGRSRGVLHELVLRKDILWDDPMSSLPTILESFVFDQLRAFVVEQAAFNVLVKNAWATLCASRSLQVLEITDTIEAKPSPSPRDSLLQSMQAQADAERDPDQDPGSNDEPVIPPDRWLYLRHLSLGGCLFQSASLLLNLGIIHLRSLRLRGVLTATPVTLLPLLEANPSLETLVVDFPRGFSFRHPKGSDSPSTRIQPVVMANLSHLELSGPMGATQFFTQVTTPNLRSLEIHRSSPPVPLSSLATQIGSLSSTAGKGVDGYGLRSLSLYGCTFEILGMIELLKCSPYLETFELTHFSGDITSIVEALRELCPRLQDIDLSHAPSLGTGVLVRLVQSRMTVEDVEEKREASKSTATKRAPLAAHLPPPETPPSATTLPASASLNSSPSPASSAMTSSAEASAGSQPIEDVSSPPVPIKRLKIDCCPRVEASVLPWLRANVRELSCVYIPKKAAAAQARRGRGRF